MSTNKTRRQITFEAARLMYSRQESEYYRAKMRAARAICRGWVKPSLLPTNAEIRDEIQRFAWMYEGEDRFNRLREMRLTALAAMQLLKEFRPKLIGSTLTGHIRSGSDIDLHLFSSSLEAIVTTLDQAGYLFDVEHKQVRKHGEQRTFTHIHIQDRFPIELTVYAADQAHYVFRSSITGKPIERASLAELEALLREETPDADLQAEVEGTAARIDRFQIYRMLLIPLAQVQQGKKHHPEGDALYHSLQVFELALDELPYDEEFLLAALLHDVGKGIDRDNHVAAALEALDGFISERTAWLIEHHMEAHRIQDGTIGARARRRLELHPDFETLQLLGECDRGGRVRGAAVGDVDDALDQIREISRMCGSE
ncbi:HD domain-containing protein [Planctomicrobium sp. SH661]|uniref:HD domain-containing protein n=1 Tax=Planctomicrobium sp. SH661 TaxID=3448124 RepID=UPI003F5CA609